MKKATIFLLALIAIFSGFHKAGAQYSVFVRNASAFTIQSTGNAIKGAFSKDVNNGGGITSSLKPGQEFFYNITPSKGTLPKGVEGTVRFTLNDPKFSGFLEIYFNNPLVGSAEFKIVDVLAPFSVKYLDKNKLANWAFADGSSTALEISVDTTRDVKPPVPWNVSGSQNPSKNYGEPIPPIINFDWQVTQRMHKDEDDDNDGKGYKMVTYFFTSNGDYAAVKPDDASFDLMIYSKHGQTWLIDDKKKTITVMNMPKTVGEGAMLGKEVAGKINKGPITKDRDDEQFSITKTDKTKNILGYTADEYEMRNTKVIASKNASKTGTVSLWYCKVPFDPVKVYTMGVGRPADVSKIQNDPKMKNNLFAIPILNKNYLWVETETGGIKGMETTEIKKVNNTIYTAGYKIKRINGLKDMLKGDDEE